MRLLVIEDEIAMRTALMETLKGQGFRVMTAASGPEGLDRACDEAPDLILLDVMLPGMDGFALCRELRRRGRRMPVLMLTARGHVDDRVNGLECGADDYLAKPFAMKELVARIRALLRRAEQALRPLTTLTFGAVVFDFEALTCLKSGRAVALTPKFFGLLKLLSENAGRAVSRQQILDAVWEQDAWPTPRTVDNYVTALRALIEPQPGHPRYIHTVRGVGYRMDPEAV